MHILSFIQYFFYLGLNWNWTIALHILIQEIKGERKYGIHTTGSDELKKLKAAGVDISNATVYMPASYILLEALFPLLPMHKRVHFVDIGCGKGRALCVAARHGTGKVTGVDFSEQFCENARQNLQLTRNKIPALDFSVVHADAARFEIPTDADCLFFFNPFDQLIMNAVAKNVRHSYQKNPRDIYVIYLNPLHKNIWIESGFKEIHYTQRMKYMEAIILKRSKPDR